MIRQSSNAPLVQKGTRGDPIFDTFYASLFPGSYGPSQQNASQASSCALLSKLKAPAILISHSIGASPAFLATDLCPSSVKAHISLEGDTTPFVNDDGASAGLPAGIPTRAYGLAHIPLTYSPPITSPSDLRTVSVGNNTIANGLLSHYGCVKQDNSTATTSIAPVRKLPNIAKVPVLLLTGEGSMHAVYDHCLVEYLGQTGVAVTWTQLADVGIKGNGHFMMLEMNSDRIAEYAYQWVEKVGNSTTSSVSGSGNGNGRRNVR